MPAGGAADRPMCTRVVVFMWRPLHTIKDTEKRWDERGDERSQLSGRAVWTGRVGGV